MTTTVSAERLELIAHVEALYMVQSAVARSEFDGIWSSQPHADGMPTLYTITTTALQMALVELVGAAAAARLYDILLDCGECVTYCLGVLREEIVGAHTWIPS